VKQRVARGHSLPGSNAERDAGNTANPDSSSNSTVSSAATPPPLPGEEQPALPQDGCLWTPGYWYWRDQGYLWIPGAWVRPPRVGMLWTPGYWRSAGNVFVFHPGYWGSAVGFYGGVNYGHGYFGNGYSGGHWIGASFAYNSAVTQLNPAIAHHTYAEAVPNQRSRAAYKPATTATAQRTTEPAPKPMEVGRPAAVVRTPAPSGSGKSNHVTPTRAAPPVK
jgi:WXXGXW repeat (2 copies)